MRPLLVGLLLAVAACTTPPPRSLLYTRGDIPRDARGEPVLAGLAPPPAAARSVAPSVAPPAVPAALPAAKPISCRHFRHC